MSKAVKYFFIICMTAITCTSTSCIGEGDSNEETIERVNVGDKVPSFTAYDENGSAVSSTDTIGGKVSILVFFTTGCKDCRRELPKMYSLWSKFSQNSAFSMMCVARDEDMATVSKFFSDENFADMPKFTDVNKTAYNAFSNKIVPRIYLIDKTGIVRYKVIETMEITVEEFENKISALL